MDGDGTASQGGKDLLTIGEAAKLLGLNEATLRNWIHEDKIPYEKVDHWHIRIPRCVVDFILEGLLVKDESRFVEEGHRYYEGEVEIPSLSAVLELGGVESTDWSLIPPAVLQRKIQIGTAVHRAVQLHLANDLDWASIDDQAYWYVVAALRYLEEEDREIIGVEVPVGSEELGYACTPDLIFPDGILEWKCTYAIRPSVEIQLAGQAVALGDRSLHRRVVQLKPDGSFLKKDFSEGVDVFEGALAVAKWKWRQGSRRRRCD